VEDVAGGSGLIENRFGMERAKRFSGRLELQDAADEVVKVVVGEAARGDGESMQDRTEFGGASASLDLTADRCEEFGVDGLQFEMKRTSAVDEIVARISIGGLVREEAIEIILNCDPASEVVRLEQASV